MSFKSKTSCFTIVRMPLTMVRDSLFESKTTCFTVSDSSDRFELNITQRNKLILNRLEEKVIDLQKLQE